MKISLSILILFVFCEYTPAGKENIEVKEKLIEYVNPFIGVEDGGGAAFVGACLPFRMVKLGPDTPLPQNTSEYIPNKPIDGFGHTYVSGSVEAFIAKSKNL